VDEVTQARKTGSMVTQDNNKCVVDPATKLPYVHVISIKLHLDKL